MSHTIVNCLIHGVFSTKERRNLISDELRPRLWAYLGGIARENSMKALAVGGTANHTHTLLALPSTLSVAKALQLLKGGSSKWVHDSFPTHAAFQWQEGYGAFSIGISGVRETIAYIENQEAHHAGRSFEEEYKAFLDRHGIAYDERYVFDSTSAVPCGTTVVGACADSPLKGRALLTQAGGALERAGSIHPGRRGLAWGSRPIGS